MNILLMTVLFCAVFAQGWRWWGQKTTEPASTPAATVADAPMGAGGEGGIVAEPSELPTRPPAVLQLPGFSAPGETAVTEPPVTSAGDTAPPQDLFRLPDLTPQTVTEAVLDRAKAGARDYPGEAWLQQYVVAAHFLLSTKQMTAGRSREALATLDESVDWGAPPGEVAAFKAAIYGAREEWEVAEKWARTAIAYDAKANPAEMHHIVGKAHYFREEMTQAIEAYRRALAIKDDPNIRASLEKATREASASAGFDRQRLSHFIVSYEGDTMEDTGRMVLDTMERSYATLQSQLGFKPDAPVVVILYSRNSYTEMGGPHWSAGLFDGKIRVPVRGLRAVDEKIKTTLHHELAHAFVNDLAGKQCPRWLQEGIAEYVEGTRTRQFGKQLAQFINEGQNFERCISAGKCDVRIFYPASASVVEYLIENRGMGGIRDVLTGLGSGMDIDRSLSQTTGRDETGLIRDWQHFIRRRYS